jgi:hypothetical protein
VAVKLDTAGDVEEQKLWLAAVGAAVGADARIPPILNP